MSSFYLGQVMMTGFGFPQKGFAQCNGTILAIQQNQALFSLLGTTFGGDGTRTFGLPDLRGRTPVGGLASQNTNWQPTPDAWGVVGGVETVSLTSDQNASHSHVITATTAPGTDPFLGDDQVLATADASGLLYGPPTALVALGAGPTTSAGAGAPHDNMQPFVAINFNIALTGIFPSRN